VFDDTFSTKLILDFCMTEMAFCFFYSSLLHYRRSFDSEQMGGWTSFLTSQRFRRTLHLNGTLVFNDCMEWVNSAMGWLSHGQHGQKIHFPFWSNCAISGYQKGMAEYRDHKDFP